MVNDLTDAIMQFRHEVRRLGYDPPDVIIFNDREAGIKILHEITKKHYLILDPNKPYGNPIEDPDGSVWMESTIADLRIRWPANKIATKNGFKWI